MNNLLERIKQKTYEQYNIPKLPLLQLNSSKSYHDEFLLEKSGLQKLLQEQIQQENPYVYQLALEIVHQQSVFVDVALSSRRRPTIEIDTQENIVIKQGDKYTLISSRNLKEAARTNSVDDAVQQAFKGQTHGEDGFDFKPFNLERLLSEIQKNDERISKITSQSHQMNMNESAVLHIQHLQSRPRPTRRKSVAVEEKPSNFSLAEAMRHRRQQEAKKIEEKKTKPAQSVPKFPMKSTPKLKYQETDADAMFFNRNEASGFKKVDIAIVEQNLANQQKSSKIPRIAETPAGELKLADLAKIRVSARRRASEAQQESSRNAAYNNKRQPEMSKAIPVVEVSKDIPKDIPIEIEKSKQNTPKRVKLEQSPSKPTPIVQRQAKKPSDTDDIDETTQNMIMNMQNSLPKQQNDGPARPISVMKHEESVAKDALSDINIILSDFQTDQTVNLDINVVQDQINKQTPKQKSTVMESKEILQHLEDEDFDSESPLKVKQKTAKIEIKEPVIELTNFDFQKQNNEFENIEVDFNFVNADVQNSKTTDFDQ